MKELPSEVAPEERITRYILNRRHIKPEKGEIKADAFLPTKPKPELPERQTSVYRTMNCEETEIWAIGDRYVENPQKKRFVLARGDLLAQTAYNQDLRIVPHPFPHPYHANIVNWPNEESPEHRKAKAVVLARESTLVVRP
ncbi:MAG: hypothetical protein F4Z24_01160 [Nitrospira sp. SB0666_bin_27]|nr:hypothetical protein [Nitrospira sp. SB0666_bin_27]MYF25706.1 hypothetical protein [Nitrospira sp. SB0678_bin_10]